MNNSELRLQYDKYLENYKKLQDEYKQLREEYEQEVKMTDSLENKIKIQNKYELLEKKQNEISDIAAKMKNYFPKEEQN